MTACGVRTCTVCLSWLIYALYYVFSGYFAHGRNLITYLEVLSALILLSLPAAKGTPCAAFVTVASGPGQGCFVTRLQ